MLMFVKLVWIYDNVTGHRYIADVENIRESEGYKHRTRLESSSYRLQTHSHGDGSTGTAPAVGRVNPWVVGTALGAVAVVSLVGNVVGRVLRCQLE